MQNNVIDQNKCNPLRHTVENKYQATGIVK